jgi:hypothetical protein
VWMLLSVKILKHDTSDFSFSCFGVGRWDPFCPLSCLAACDGVKYIHLNNLLLLDFFITKTSP